MDEEKPDTRHLVMKPKVVIPTDPISSPGDASRITVQQIHRQNREADERRSIGKRGDAAPLASPVPTEPPLSPVFKHRDITVMNPPSRPGEEEAVTVFAILLENRMAEEKSGWGRLKRWKRRKSRRNRDFILIVGTLDLGIALFMKMSPDVMTVAYGLSAITLTTSTLGWVMFAVMDDY